MTKIVQNQLHKLLKDSFNDSELNEFCFELGISPEELGGRNKSEKIIELIGFCDRRKRIPEVLELCANLRPKLPWPSYGSKPSGDVATQNRILIVEDDEVWQEHLKSYLETDFICDVVSDYNTAFRKLMASPPDAIVLDLKLGDQHEDGHKLAGKARLERVAFVVVSGDSKGATVSRFLDYNEIAVGFFDKSTLVDNKQEFINKMYEAVKITIKNRRELS